MMAALSGCSTMNASMPGTLRSDVSEKETESTGSVKIERTHFFFLWGLLGAPDKSFFVDELTKQVSSAGGDGVANLRYESQAGCVSLLITGFTCGIVSPRDYKVTGDVVRIKVPALAGGVNPALEAPPPAPGANPTPVPTTPTPTTPDTPPPSYAY
jgi:hypothetical protein